MEKNHKTHNPKPIAQLKTQPHNFFVVGNVLWVMGKVVGNGLWEKTQNPQPKTKHMTQNATS